VAGSAGIAQPAPTSERPDPRSELLRALPDVTIFVIPTSGDTARVSLAYRKRVPHALVRQDIGKLTANGWGIAAISVVDASIRPGDPVHAPVTTGGQFRLIKAPQVVNNAPVVLPYLRAFQNYDHVSLVFNLSDLKPYNGVEAFTSSALVVQRMPEQNAYHYEALIQDHKGRLPELVANTVSALTPVRDSKPPAPVRPSGVPLLPLMLTLMCAGIVGGFIGYSWLAKRAGRVDSP
jgi:hypothetical protein